MSTINGKARYLVALAALAALGFGSFASSVVLATGNGRDTNHCVQACNVLRDYCWTHCPGRCDSAYTPGTADHDLCLDICRFQCAAYIQFCRGNCNASTIPGDEPEP